MRKWNSFEKLFGIQIGWRIWIKGLFFTRSSSSIKLQFIEEWVGIIRKKVVHLIDNVRYGLRWIRDVIELDCEEGLGFSQGFKIVRYLGGSTTKKRGTQLDNWYEDLRTGSDRWNQREKFHWLLRFIRIVYIWFNIGLFESFVNCALVFIIFNQYTLK